MFQVSKTSFPYKPSVEGCTYEEGEGYFQKAIKSSINMVK